MSVLLAKIDSDSVAVCDLPFRKIYPSLKYLINEVNLAGGVWNESTPDQNFKTSLFRTVKYTFESFGI